MALGGRCLFRVERLLERGRLLKEIRYQGHEKKGINH